MGFGERMWLRGEDGIMGMILPKEEMIFES
jgi:hypothetical protein